MKIDGKRVLITGGSSGIGLETARALIAGGARVVITGRDAAKAEKAAAEIGAIAGISADVTTDAGRQATLAAAKDALGGLDVLINNAGGVRAGRLEDTREDEIATMIAVDLIGPILLTRAALPILRHSGDAMIVNVSSGIALVSLPFYATYAAVKAGIAHFGEALRRELGGEGIHVLTVYPTATETPMMRTSGMGKMRELEAPESVAEAIVAGIAGDAIEVVRGDDDAAKMRKLNQSDPAAVDAQFAKMKPQMAEAAKDHSAL